MRLLHENVTAFFRFFLTVILIWLILFQKTSQTNKEGSVVILEVHFDPFFLHCLMFHLAIHLLTLAIRSKNITPLLITPKFVFKILLYSEH